MKYPTHIYAKALAEVIVTAKKGEEAKVAANFIALVRKGGDEVHLRKIVEEAARFVRGKSGVRKVTIGMARTLTAGQMKTVKSFLKAGDVVEERIDPALIAGIRITLDDELQMDGSLKGKLDKIFAVQA
ncbi:MAG TPA: F0F1 ATP synthase subunit delta [Candidatus Paceibacterota bacterium]|jgi:F0F1-type ATP synthase delta subunit|nr:F0F1 ATP synthase subunit delta [Candidatus Paceibacterota bacterium]